MSATSKIEWTEATWNPLVGCTKVSPGCDNCYAATQVNTRFHPAALAKGGKHLEAFPTPFETVSIRPDRFLTQPLHWPEPKRIFVNSLSDLFHKDVPDSFIVDVWAIMAQTPRHTYQILTKRHARMRSLLSSPEFTNALMDKLRVTSLLWPLSNVWLGVSVESQEWADRRIPELLRTPAMVRWISAEPLLGPLNLAPWLLPSDMFDQPSYQFGPGKPVDGSYEPDVASITYYSVLLDWVVVGGESGPGARPMHPDWARSLRDQCAAAGVPFLFKQWGNWRPLAGNECAIAGDEWPAGTQDVMSRNVGKKAAGRELDGRTWDEYPAVTA